MKKLLLIVGFTLSISFFSAAQSGNPVTPSEQATLDSMRKADEFLNMLDSLDAPKSYIDLSIGIGNRLFSVKNNSVNTTQAYTNKLYYTPAITYRHKSGLSIGLMPFITSDSGSLKTYQTAITPGYDYLDKKISTGLSYTRFIADNEKYNSNSIYQNDFYAYIKSVAGWVEPGFAVGFTNGKYKEIDLVYAPMLARYVKDSTDNKIRDISFTASIEHDFEFYDVLAKQDGLSIVPQLLLSGGSEKLTITHTNKAYAKLVNASRRVKRNITVDGSSKFALQSTALSIDITYSVGKFFLQPNVYFDYYLPSTTEKRFTTVYSITAGFSF